MKLKPSWPRFFWLCKRALRESWQAMLLCCLLMLHVLDLCFGPLELREMDASFGDDLPEVDSFSQPDIAVDLLKQYAQNLFFAYTVGESTTNHSWGFGTAATSSNNRRNELMSWGGERTKGGDDAAKAPLCNLQPQVRGLYVDLLLKLLAVHHENVSGDQFLNCYLELLAIAPDDFGLVSWTRSALAYSANCGRTSELIEALEHSTRFNHNSRTVSRVQQAIEDWREGRIKAVANAVPGPETYSLCVAANPFAERTPDGL